jgi:peptide/nickel transport system substrate-binding protein
MHRRHLWLAAASLLVALGLVTAASASRSHSAAPKVKIGGTLLFGAEQEPDCLNALLNPCNQFWASMMTQTPVISTAYIIQPDFSYKPTLISKATLQLRPMRLTYFIKPQARWSDGKPVTGQDFVFTLKTIMNKKYDIVSRTGYELIRGSKVSGSGKMKNKIVKFTFRKPYAPWKELFGTYVLPSHVLKGADFSTVWNDAIVNPKNGQPIGSGPFLVSKWQKGSSLTIVRNPKWWGPHRPYLNSIIWRFLTNTNTEIQQVRGGEVDAIYPQPQLELAELRQAPGLVVKSSLGSTWEHIDIQQGPKGNPLAKNLWVRQALILSLDRNSVLQALFRTLNPRLQVLQNTLYFNNFPQYEAHWNKWNYNPNRARQILESHGCRKGGDGIYSCGGTRLTFQFESTRGNKLREFAFTIAQDIWKKNGVEVKDNFKPASIAFGTDLVQGNYDLFMFAWVGSPDPTGSTAIWSCPNNGGTQNYMSYCNNKVTDLLKQADQELNDKKRVQLVNQADALMANDIPTIPLYQKPTFLVTHSYVKGMNDNPTNASPSYNIQDWWLNK